MKRTAIPKFVIICACALLAGNIHGALAADFVIKQRRTALCYRTGLDCPVPFKLMPRRYVDYLWTYAAWLLVSSGELCNGPSENPQVRIDAHERADEILAVASAPASEKQRTLHALISAVRQGRTPADPADCSLAIADAQRVADQYEAGQR